MKFFLANIISIHQSAFLNALSVKHEVVLVVEKDLEKERRQQGWSVPGLEKINIVVAPSENQTIEILNESAVQVFSGIAAYPLVRKAFRYAIKNGLKTGVLMEPFNWIGLKGKIRWLKYYLMKIRFGNKIDFIATTGELGTSQYASIGFDKHSIFEWGYFVELSELLINNEINKGNLQKPLFCVGVHEERNSAKEI